MTTGQITPRAGLSEQPARPPRSCDGPELTSYALADWCRFSGTGACFIEPGSPLQNAYAESLNSRITDEPLNQKLSHTLLEAQVLVED